MGSYPPRQPSSSRHNKRGLESGVVSLSLIINSFKILGPLCFCAVLSVQGFATANEVGSVMVAPFVNVTYKGPLGGTTTANDAIFNPENDSIIYHSTMQHGIYKGYKKWYECIGREHFVYLFIDYPGLNDAMGQPEPISTGKICNVRRYESRVPTWMNILDEDGSLFSRVTFQF